MSGQLIGNRYRVLRKIGEGGMAVVHLAVDEKLGRDVAVKILKERFESHNEIRARFQHEARVISAFDHQNILKIFDFSGEDSRQLWIVTELIHGRNVAQILETTPSGWLHPVIAASITREICGALSTAHEQGIVHRDVKPENVMITHQGRVKLMDFGIAKIQRVTSMTQTGMFMGSPSYMSPEQIRGRDIDHRSDVYSLGVLLYELLTGRLPFTGSSTADIAMRILSGEFTHPRYIMSGLPDELNQCVVSCMHLNAEERPQSIEQVGIVLDRFLESLSLDRSAEELERCFRDPLAYGERLSRLLRVTSAKASSTVIVDEFLPPRPPVHSNAHRNKPDAIAKHLPERRHKQRPTVVMRQPSPDAAAKPAQQNSEPTQIIRPQNPRRNPAPPRDQNLQVQQQLRAPSRPTPQPAPRRPSSKNEYRHVSRTVPPSPRRHVNKVRYVIHNVPVSRGDSGFFGKFVVAILLLMAVGFLMNDPRRPMAGKSKTISGQGTKPQKPPATILSTADTNADTKADNKADNKIEAKDLQISTQRTERPNLTQSESTKPNASEKADVAPSPTTQKISKSPNKSRGKLLSNSPSTSQSDQKAASIAINPSKNPIKTARNQTPNPAILGKNKTSTDPQPQKPSQVVATNVTLKNSDEHQDDTDLSILPIQQNAPRPRQSEKLQVSPTPTPTPTDAPASKGKVSVSSTPAAELYIDGKRYGTTNDLGASSEWIELASGAHRLELRRAGFLPRIESVQVTGDSRQKLGPYTLQRGDTSTNKTTSYRLTLSTNTPPVTVTLINIETRATQNIQMNQSTQTINLERGIFDVTMNHNGDIRKRRIDLSGAAQQLTFSVDFKQDGPP